MQALPKIGSDPIRPSGGRESALPCLARLASRAHILHVLPDEQASPKQIEFLRRLTPEQRWRAAHRLYWTMRRHKLAFLRCQHPQWSDRQLQEEVRRIFTNAR